MYCHLTDPAIKNIAVLDMTHGGVIIARKLKELEFNVIGVDVYGTLSTEQCSSLEADGIRVVDKSCPTEDLDLVISPVHLYPDHIMLQQIKKKHVPLISHHRAVGEILAFTNVSEYPLIIEITGTKAKTSTASLLADMISRKLTVVLHTSRGLELWENGVCQLIHKGLSIAPGSILQVMDIAGSLDKKIEAYIFEVSLGVTGCGSVGIITTLDMDYMIAGKTSMASEAKVKSLLNCPENTLFVLNENCKQALKQLDIPLASENISTFSIVNKSENETLNSDYCLNVHNNNVSIICGKEIIEFCLIEVYDAKSYMTAFAASCAAAFEISIPLRNVKETIQQFRGLQGRMQETVEENIKFLDNSNSGMEITSVEKALDHCLKKRRRVIMVLGEEAAQVCEGLPPENVSDFLGSRLEEIDELILVGERMKPLATGNIYYAQSFDIGKTCAMKLARKKSPAEVIIALCVKCFR
ncbi:coenzyme F430 synthase [uncultured Methanomethylovorans sp.]|uniref:coenzyme F430 synthase n=1 Tax=uncultured Methanomethylovorans sp. TaxID=183759 RepID=UPI002AA73DC6|nr:coenzyme F430 synthase [uncultured Methanomethylovorans sp.]